ncbi:hypothetical protein [Streptomyces europaeiscabiei]|uniref:hypothetical protein n=2 Tax=Streptomyces TaxID=1883 RepID=UPI0029BCF6CC|nr:hypothetical protein [Streptomyces europaeiscabiei]MDX3587826.1 hypothetical protein [Streptomyces europaeiscabiei]MDX3619084.1 hypothetical protein [Streptomyces europaeiscabiei]
MAAAPARVTTGATTWAHHLGPPPGPPPGHATGSAGEPVTTAYRRSTDADLLLTGRCAEAQKKPGRRTAGATPTVSRR